MASKSLTALEKLAALEAKKEQLVKAREAEIISLFKKNGSLTIADNLLAGFLAFVNNKENEKHPILTEFASLARGAKNPSPKKA